MGIRSLFIFVYVELNKFRLDFEGEKTKLMFDVRVCVVCFSLNTDCFLCHLFCRSDPLAWTSRLRSLCTQP